MSEKTYNERLAELEKRMNLIEQHKEKIMTDDLSDKIFDNWENEKEFNYNLKEYFSYKRYNSVLYDKIRILINTNPARLNLANSMFLNESLWKELNSDQKYFILEQLYRINANT